MSFNQAAPLQGAEVGFGGTAAGQFEPIGEVRVRSRKMATTPAILRGQVVAIDKSGGNKGKIRTAVAGDLPPYGMAVEDKALNALTVRYISQEGVFVNVVASGAIAPNMPVTPDTGGKVKEAGTTDPVFGYFIKLAAAVTDADGVSVTAAAVLNDVITVVTDNGGLGA